MSKQQAKTTTEHLGEGHKTADTGAEDAGGVGSGTLREHDPTARLCSSASKAVKRTERSPESSQVAQASKRITLSSVAEVPLAEAQLGANMYDEGNPTQNDDVTDLSVSNDSDMLIHIKDILTPLLEVYTNRICSTINIRIDVLYDRMNNLFQEIKCLSDNCKEYKDEIERLKIKVKVLGKDNAYMSKALENHQKFLESIDKDQRKANLIITGIDENKNLDAGNENPATTDEDKVKYVIKKATDTEFQIDGIIRLGRPSTEEGRGPRAIKVTLRDPLDRVKILQGAAKLKTQEHLKKIFIKKDQHPGIYREINRLKRTEREEKAKPENIGKNVYYDWKTRCVYVDNQIIDSFSPSFF